MENQKNPQTPMENFSELYKNLEKKDKSELIKQFSTYFNCSNAVVYDRLKNFPKCSPAEVEFFAKFFIEKKQELIINH